MSVISCGTLSRSFLSRSSAFIVRVLFHILTLYGVVVGRAAHAEPLTLTAALTLAEQQAPELQAQTAVVQAAQSAAIAAGRLPNPTLTLGIDNLPVTGMDQWRLNRDPMTMQKIGVMQELPNGRKRVAQKDAATAAVTQAEAEIHVRRVAVRRAVALAWFNRYYLERRLRVFDELDAENRLFADSVQAQLAGGKGLPADTVAPQQEAAELADRRDQLQAGIASSKAGLRRWVGTAGDEPLAEAAPEFNLDTGHLIAQVHEHPELQVFAPRLEAAQADVRAAQATQRPDWSVELMYGHRDAAYGDMVSAQVSIGLPLFSGTRIEPQIQAKQQAVTQIMAERDALLREHRQMLETELAEYRSLARQVARMRDIRLPLAQQKVALQFASYQANQAELSAVLDARRELIDARLDLIALQAAHAALAATLYFSYGEGAP